MGLTREEALKIMGLEEGCSTKEIRDRFKKLALKWHPDKNIDNPDEAQKKFQAISAAYTKLVSSDSEEEDDDIPNDSLREMFARIWQSHNRGAFSSDPHLFCDCDACQADWEDLSLDDFIGSDSDPDDDFYYDDSLYADDLLRQFGEKLYRKYNEHSGRAEKKAKQMWTGSGYRGSVTAEEASKNAEELLEAEEREKRAAEKKKKRNRKKKESKKRRKAKQEDGCSEETPPPETPPPDKEEEEEEKKAAEDEELQDEKVIRETAEERHKPDKTDSKDKTETVQQANVVDNKSRRNTSDKTNNARHSEASKKGATAAVKPVPGAVGNKKKGREGKDEEEEEEEESIPSEDELDYSSAFLSRAKVLAAARGPKTRDKNPPATEKWQQQESRQKRKITEQKTDTRPDPDPSDTKPKRNRFKLRQKPPQQQQQQQQGRTANRGPGHSKLASAGMNGSVPVFTASNGHDQVPAVGVVVEAEEEEDDLSPVDMSQAKLYEANIPQSKLLAGEGNRAAKAGEFEEAVLRYSEAISLYPFDHRYFGNRSFCYDYLQDYAKAVTDANSALRIDINWAKGFYRRGRGLAGLKRYEAAVTAFTRALDLNPEYGEAREQLEMVQLEQLQGMGFPLEASRRALAEYHTVPAAIEAMVKNTGGGGGGGGGGGSEGGGGKKHKKHGPEYTPVYNHSGFEIPPRMLIQTIPPKNCSLWVGNINSHSLTQGLVTNLFQKYGQVLSVRMLYERRCAFVNYARPESATEALKKLQGHTVGGCVLLLRYPENNPAKPANWNPPSSAPPPRSKGGATAAAGAVEECQYWRSSGCNYGDQCRYLHLPESRGVDSGYYGDHPSQ